MRVSKFIIILPFLWWGFDARAQVDGQMPVPEKWQLTLDVIKTKARNLMVENSGLQVEYRQLRGQVQKLQQSIDDLKFKNDQQLRIEELTRIIKAKRQRAGIVDEELVNLGKKQSDMDNKVRLLKQTISNIKLRPQSTAQPLVDGQLAQWRKQLEDEKRQEVLLENELGDLKAGNRMQNLDAVVTANGHSYDQLQRKDQLEADISNYESRMDQLRETSLAALSWPLKRKKLIHDLVLADARNNDMRDQIKVLHEDIGILRDQAAKLQRRLDSVKVHAAGQ